MFEDNGHILKKYPFFVLDVIICNSIDKKYSLTIHYFDW